jgi:DnaJ family protein C protein 13
MGETEAMSVLEIKERPEDSSKWDDLVRTQYRRLARQFHPDRNPEGRDRFESIQKAYELLSSVRKAVSTLGPDPVSIDLLLRTQCLLFRRFKTELAPYKYAGYPLLLQSLKITKLHSLHENEHILVHAAHLAYLTCLCCALNARELTRVKGVERMSKLLVQSMLTVTNTTPRNHPSLTIASHILHSLAGLAAFEAARERMVHIPLLIKELVRCTALIQAPKTIHYSLEAIGRSTVDIRLQALLVQSGVSLYLLPLLLQFDEGLDDVAEAKEQEQGGAAAAAGGNSAAAVKDGIGKQGENVQEEANHSAKLGARALR